jgi:diaminobutyrate-2-oxoglutarate transaminase
LDFFSGAGGQNYGHNHPAIKQEMINYLSSNGVLHSLDMATDVKISFINTFKDIILKPRKLDYRLQFTGPTGANAVEAALKLARLKTGRSNVIAFTHSFHGVSLGALAATSNSHFREAAGVSLTNVTFLPYDNYVSDIDSSEYLKLMLEDRSSGVDMPAAIILETIQGEGGINIASSGWLRRVADIASEYGILLIVDDIQAGCGRSGDFFSFEESGIVPDIVVLSKSISGSGSPMSLLLIKPEHDIWQPAQHNGTFRGNTLAFVSARAAINTFWKNVDFSNDIKRKGNIIRNSLRDISTNNKEFGLEVRGKGMINGLVFEDESIAAQARRLAFDN